MKKTLSGREQQIMDVIWDAEKPLSHHEIFAALKKYEISIYTIQQTTQRLINKGVLKVAGYEQGDRAVHRVFSPAVSRYDYIFKDCSRETKHAITLNYIKSIRSKDEIEEFITVLQNKLDKLNSD